jgi:hypothetical protein
MKQRTMAIVALALAASGSTSAEAAAVVGGYAYAYADADRSGGAAPTFNRRVATRGNEISASASQGSGAQTSSRSQSGAWSNRIEVTSTATDPQSIVFGNAASLFAINQRITGAPGSRPVVSYTFGIDGSFAPGPVSTYPEPQFLAPQNLSFFLVAYRGRALGTRVGNGPTGDFLEFVSTNGTAILGRGADNTNPNDPFRLGAAAACFGPDTRCTQGGSFNDRRTISFALDADTDYFVLGFLASDTNGNTDFFNTARLESIALAPEFDLISDDGGALKRTADGSFALAVPEPSTWMMAILGFGLVGATLRRDRTRPASLVTT